MTHITETAGVGPRRAVLAGIRLAADSGFDRSMKELKGLAEACGVEVCGSAEQARLKEDPAYAIGRGKVDEIKKAADTLEADIVIFNNTLSPSQLSNLSNALDLEVIDRTMLILNIFAERAKSRESMMQVDYAKLKYMLPRLVGLRSNLSRQGGTGGTMSNRGSGEKKIELDRRVIEKRMTLLRRELDSISKIRDTQTKKRIRSGLPLVSLVGYTNAGKSTLMNLMLSTFSTDDEKRVESEDMLFATLDTSVRRIEIPGMRPFLLSDTVGFISDLPTMLIDAFHSTLNEALNADLLLEVIDASDPDRENHIKVTESTLAELGAGNIPIIQIMNKADIAHDTVPDSDGTIAVSAVTGKGLDRLIRRIRSALDDGHVRVTLLIPWKDSGAESRLRAAATVLSSEYTDNGILITALLDRSRVGEYQRFILP